MSDKDGGDVRPWTRMAKQRPRCENGVSRTPPKNNFFLCKMPRI